MGFDTIIANGKVVTATDTYLADIAISAGKIEVVGQNLPRQNAARVLEAMGKYVFPGGIDVHTHLEPAPTISKPGRARRHLAERPR